MWDQIGCICSEELQPNGKNSQQNSGDRRKCNNYTSTLKELAQMLPIPMRTSCKRLTKKEILLRVLHYIEHLQASVDTARSLLQVRCGEQKGSEQMAASALKRGQREATPRAKKTKPLGVCKKPRKRRRTRKSERRGVSKKVCKCLALETEKGPSQADMCREESVSAVEEVSALLSSSQKQSEYYRPASAPFLDITKDWNLGHSQEESKDGDVFSVCAAQVAYEGPGHSPMGQKLVHYYSSCEEEASRDSPWLSTQSPVNSSHGSMQLCSPRIEAQSNTCSDLGLSPSLFTSPARLLPRHILHGSQDELSPVLFEDVYLSPQSSSFSQGLSGTLLRKSAFTLDHCYLSYNETGKSNSSPMSRMNGRTSLWNKQYLQEVRRRLPEFPVSSSDENSDSTWTPPSKRVRPSQVSSQKKMKKVVRRQRRRPAAGEKRSSSSPLQLKKKCVNGFIMFCRLNRKHYIRACPGMASTAATRELAQLWRMMTKQERKPYCMKARRFSRLNNRIVRDDFSSGEEDPEPPKPFHMLLAEKSLHGSQTFGDLSLLKLMP
nr:basic helix-loop-helix and HMG box domain-containing protein 1 [Zootoca vivipara]